MNDLTREHFRASFSEEMEEGRHLKFDVRVWEHSSTWVIVSQLPETNSTYNVSSLDTTILQNIHELTAQTGVGITVGKLFLIDRLPQGLTVEARVCHEGIDTKNGTAPHFTVGKRIEQTPLLYDLLAVTYGFEPLPDVTVTLEKLRLPGVPVERSTREIERLHRELVAYHGPQEDADLSSYLQRGSETATQNAALHSLSIRTRI